MTSKKFSLILLITITTIIKSNAQEKLGLGMILEGNEKDTLSSIIVLKKGPMAKAGLLSTDLLQAVNSKSLLNMTIDQVLKTLNNEPPNNVKIDILRNGKPMSFTVNKVPEISYDRECTSGNCKDGTGTLTFRDGQYYYVGLCKDNKILGPGKIYIKDRLLYEGQFVNENYQGKGKFFYDDGAVYEGFFWKGLQSGNGNVKISASESYSGMFKNGYPSGFGTYLKDAITYTGFFHGWQGPYFGKFSKNNITYSGYFRNFKLLGYAKMEYNSGEFYEGEISNDLPNGVGFICKDGKKVIHGEFKDGKLLKQIEYSEIEIGGFSYYPFSDERLELLRKYKTSNNFYTELYFIMEASKSDFEFLIDKRTKQFAIIGNDEIADSRMKMPTTNGEYDGQINFPANGGKRSFLGYVYKSRDKEKGNQYVKDILEKVKEKLGNVAYTESDLTQPAQKAKGNIKKSYTFKFSQPYDTLYELTLIILVNQDKDGEVEVFIEILSAQKK